MTATAMTEDERALFAGTVERLHSGVVITIALAPEDAIWLALGISVAAASPLIARPDDVTRVIRAATVLQTAIQSAGYDGVALRMAQLIRDTATFIRADAEKYFTDKVKDNDRLP